VFASLPPLAIVALISLDAIYLASFPKPDLGIALKRE